MYADPVILKEAIRVAGNVFNDYGTLFTDPLKYRCDILLAQISVLENVRLDSHPFSGDFCGMLHIDEYENTIVYNLKQPKERRNFTIAHEFGHYFLHRTKKSQFADRTKEILDTAIVEFEIQANAFASYLVLPKSILTSMLNEKFSFFRIAKTAQISYSALYWRILNHITETTSLNKENAIFIVDDFKNFSIARSKNLAHHAFSLVYSLHKNLNLEKMIERRKENVHFIKDKSDDIIDIEMDPYVILEKEAIYNA